MTNQPPTQLPNPDHPHMKDLLGWYIFNEGGLTVFDYSHNKAHATANGNINLSVGSIGLSRSFPVASDIILTQVPPLLEYTVNWWMMRTAFNAGTQVAVGFGHPSDGGREVFFGSGIGGFLAGSFELSSVNFNILANNPWFTNRWYNFCITRAGNNITGGYRAYFSGRFMGSANTLSMNISGSNNWAIGARNFGGSFNNPFQTGNLITNVRIYNRVLTEKQIAEMATDPYAPFALDQPFPFPPFGLTPVNFGPVGRGPIRSANDLGTINIGGAP